MRRLILAAAVAVTAVTSFGVPSFAGGMYLGQDFGHRQTIDSKVTEVGHYYGHRRKCWWKKVRRYDEYGDVYWERVRVCR